MRCIVSPAAIVLAPVPRRLDGAVRESVPLEIVWLALVELVKVANVPRPAIDAAAPSAAIESKTFFERVKTRVRIVFLSSVGDGCSPSPRRGLREVNSGSS